MPRGTRFWCFTCYDMAKVNGVIAKITGEETDLVTYFVCQCEECPTTKKQHYQGYIEFRKNISMIHVKAFFDDVTLHLERRRGTSKEASDYCKKQETRFGDQPPFEWGTLSTDNRGIRSDLSDLYARVRAGASDRDLVEDNPTQYMRNYRAIARVRGLFKPKRSKPLIVKLFYGAPGTGKTHMAYESAPDLYAVPISDRIWLDGYDGQKTILIDDFAGRASALSLSHLLQLIDNYVCSVQCKGSFTWINCEEIIITSNVHPHDWYDYSNREVHYRALARRFKEVWEFSEDTVPDRLDEEKLKDFWNNWENW